MIVVCLIIFGGFLREFSGIISATKGHLDLKISCLQIEMKLVENMVSRYVCDA